MNVMFMGTPELAAECLRAVYEKEGVNVCAVVTRPDKPSGRGMKMVFSPVKEFAVSHDIPVYQPKTLKDGAFQSVLDEHRPELIIVAAYGNILPHYVIEYPKYGCVNAHGSLLPKYRGASPIQRAILDGEKVTGITAMYMDDGLDTGDIIEKYECEIKDDDDFGTLHDRLAVIAGQAMCDVIDRIISGTITRTPQGDEGTCYAAKIEKEETVLDFSLPAQSVLNKIRAFSPVPYAMTHTPDGKALKIAHAVLAQGEGTPGTVIETYAKGEGRIVIACGDGAVSVDAVVPEGKKKMSAGEFIRGRKINTGDILKEKDVE